MSQHFIISIQSGTAKQRNDITDVLGPLGGYWHWMPDFWLLHTHNDSLAADYIRYEIHQRFPFVIFLVLKVYVPEGISWAGVFPTNQMDLWSLWLNQYWKPLG